MRLSESWLREWVNPSIDTQTLADQLTLAGLEVDAIEAVADFTGVVVGEIVACEQHPDADKLRVCQVQADEDTPLQIVCGAPNARVGIKVPLAKVNAILSKTEQAPQGFKIKKAKLRGVESYGMLCGPDELGIGDDTGGLYELGDDAKTGQCLKEYLNLNDTIIEVDLTPNRSDCLSIQGVAREISAINKVDMEVFQELIVDTKSDLSLPVSLEHDACAHYCGRVIEGVDLSATSPTWLVEKLRRSDIRSIDPVVDVTNYVMLEIGQPMHAFDLAKISEKISVRMAKENEKLTLLDGKEIELHADTLVIADAEKALALAGIMGGADTGVSETTTNIFLESAFFTPVELAGKARDYGLHTDASHRFERGVDPKLQLRALHRATELLLDIVGGKAGAITEESRSTAYDQMPTIRLRQARVNDLLGMELDGDTIVTTLSSLGMMINETGKGEWTVEAPSYRFDINREVDLIEELARLYGYNNLAVQPLHIASDQNQNTEESILPLARLESLLIDRDYQEIISYSFISPALAEQFAPDTSYQTLLNPISQDLSVMRPSLLPGLVSTLQHNLNRQQSRVRLFETGLCFEFDKESKLQQNHRIGGLIYGELLEENWSGSKTPVDFFDIKGDVEALFAVGNEYGEWHALSDPSLLKILHPGQSAEIAMAGVTVGFVGALHPQLQKTLGLKQSTYVFQLDTKPLKNALLPWFKPLSKFPEVRRDLAFVIKKDVQVANIITVISKEKVDYFKKARIFDIYEGETLGEDLKSIAVALFFQAEAETLKDEEVNKSINHIVTVLSKNFDIELRS